MYRDGQPVPSIARSSGWLAIFHRSNQNRDLEEVGQEPIPRPPRIARHLRIPVEIIGTPAGVEHAICARVNVEPLI